MNSGKTKLFAFIVAVVVFATALIFALCPNGRHSIDTINASIDAITVEDVGVFDIKDDFRFNGEQGGLNKSYYLLKDNMSTAPFGDYGYGLLPASSFGEDCGNVGNGFIEYKLFLDPNGEFPKFRNMNLNLEYYVKNLTYHPSFEIYYSYNGSDFTKYSDFSPEVVGEILTEKINLTDLVCGERWAAEKKSEYLYVKIEVLHDAVLSLSKNEVSVRVMSVGFDGMENFGMNEGNAARLSAKESTDLFFKTYFARDVFDALRVKYNENFFEIYFGTIVEPYDYITSYGEINADNIAFDGVKAYYKAMGQIEGELVNNKTRSFVTNKDGKYKIVKNNNVEYYYFYGGVASIKDKNLERDYTARSYIAIYDIIEEKTQRIYSSYKNDASLNHSPSIALTAQRTAMNNSEYAGRMNDYFLGRITDKNKGYTVTKVYIDGLSIKDITKTAYSGSGEYSADLGTYYSLKDEQKTSGHTDYTLLSDDNVVTDGTKVVYKSNSTAVILVGDKTEFVLIYRKV